MSLIFGKENFKNLTDEEKEIYNLIDKTINKYLEKEDEND